MSRTNNTKQPKPKDLSPAAACYQLSQVLTVSVVSIQHQPVPQRRRSPLCTWQLGNGERFKISLLQMADQRQLAAKLAVSGKVTMPRFSDSEWFTVKGLMLQCLEDAETSKQTKRQWN